MYNNKLKIYFCRIYFFVRNFVSKKIIFRKKMYIYSDVQLFLIYCCIVS